TRAVGYDESPSSQHSKPTIRPPQYRDSPTAAAVQPSQASTLEKRAINDQALDDDDDDDDLIADDVSDTGTYTIEIDNEGQRHRKKDENSSETEARSRSDHAMLAAEDLGSDYEADSDDVDL